MQPRIAQIFNRNLFLARCATCVAAVAVACSLIFPGPSGSALAQNATNAVTQPGPQAVPGFWDPRRRPDRPDLSKLTVIRFLTETDYPPFNFTGPDGNPAGFNVDLARLLCEEIKVTCTVQMRRFETLLDAVASNRGDAIIASLAVTPQTRARLDFTDPYYRAPARFVARKRCGAGGNAAGISRRQEGRRDRRLRARGLSEGDVHRRGSARLRQ